LQLPRNSVMFYAPNKHEPLKFVKAEDLSVEQLNDLILKQIPQNTQQISTAPSLNHKKAHEELMKKVKEMEGKVKIA
jgi:hypothetical protein